MYNRMYRDNRQSRSGGDGGSRHRRDRGGEGRQRHRSNQRGRSSSRSRSNHRNSNNNDNNGNNDNNSNSNSNSNSNNSGGRNNNNRIRDRSNIRQRYSTRSPLSSDQWRRNESHSGGSSGDRYRNNRRRHLSCQSHGADDSYYRHGGTSNRSNRSSRRGSRSYSSSSDDSYYRRGGTSSRRYRSPRRGRRGSRSFRSSDSSPTRGRENAAREAMAQSALHLRGDLNPALGLGLPGLTDAQGIESQQLIRTQQLIRNQQPSALDQMMAQNKSPDGLKPTMPSIEQLLAQVNANYAINSRASTGQPNNFFESATNLKALVGNDLVGNNQPRKPLGTASALNNLIQGSVQCFRHNGYGFISPADGSKEEFFHCNQINKVGIRSHLIGGETVTFNKEFDSHRKKWYATNVMLSLPVKPPLEVGTNISPTTSSNTGDKKKSKEQNYDGDDDDDDDGYSGDDENEIPSVDHRDKWGFLITAKRMSIKNDRENVKKKMTVVTMKQRLPKIPDDALSTIAKLTGDFQSILNLSIADPTLAVTISQWKCCDCDGPIFGSNRAYFRSLQEELGILSIPSTAKPFICKHGTFCDRNDCSGSNARQCSQCGVVMECGLCQKSQITDCKICTEVQQDSFYCRNCQGGCEEKYTPLL